ncbi:MAG: VOC family protein [Congregibacter sp.]|nr:VOC family protein [Congregibacter sp.]MDP5071273.1 VOC family protein [Congregibacter sp.]
MTNPILAIAQLEIAVPDLPTQIHNYAALLDTAPLWQGSVDGKDIAILQTGNVAVHLVACEQSRGLRAIDFEVDSLARMQRRLKRVGIAAKEQTVGNADFASHAPAQRLVAAKSDTRGIQLSFSERSPAASSASALAKSSLDHIVIGSASAEGTAFLFGSQLGLDMRMDINRPQWKARLLFFRCGDLIIEVFQSLDDQKPPAETAKDHFYGLSWRVDNADTAQQRLTRAGFDVSAVRAGRRPDSRVLTVRNKTADVATLLIEPPYR